MAEIDERLQASLSDRYTIEQELGRGGMATVFLAKDLKHERQVAIKVLHPELAATLGGERFDREIKLAARLQHPHILSLYDSGEADGLLYYVMPYVEGESLRDRLNRERLLPIDDALQIAIEVADALSYAHMLGIIHRDIKPENILLTGGHALVADFGIARAVTSAGGEKLTQTGMALGTPLYMSPEQATGEEVGPSADIYSLACMLYEMLAGQPPFTGPNARAIMARHAMDSVPGLRLVRDTVPEEVEDAILCALAKVPADRPQTAAQFADLLGLPLGSTATRRVGSRSGASRRISTVGRRVSTASGRRLSPAESRRISTQETVQLEGIAPRRRTWLWGLLAIPVAAAIAFVVWRQRPHAPVGVAAGGLDPKRVAVLYFDDQSPKHELGYLADGLTEALIGALSEVPSLHVISKGGVASFRGGAVPRDSIARALQAGTLVQGSVEQEGSGLRATVRLIDGGSGAEFQRASSEQRGGNVLALRDSLASDVARLIRARLGEEIRIREQREGTSSPDAWAQLQRADQARKRADSLAAAGDTAGLSREFRAADSLAATVERLDPKWIDPIILRGSVAYRRSRLAVDDPQQAGKWIDLGMGHVQRALAIDANNPDALELRGNLQYWRWLLNLEPDANKAQALLKAAQQDLETAVRIHPAQAGAWATLSHLYYQTGSIADVSLAARRALEEDAYLSNANVIQARLFFASYDQAQFIDATHWCQEGQRRFPTDRKFVECQLLLLATKGTDPDVPKAWRLADSLFKLTPEPDRPFQQLSGQMAVAAVLARASLADSARHLVERSKGDAQVDPTRDLIERGAFVYTLLGDRDEALKLLKVYLAANPQRRSNYAEDPGWQFRSLAEDPRFGQMVGSKP